MTLFKLRYVGFFLILSILVVGCKNKKEQATQQKQQKIQQRRADSLRMVQQRRDSLRQARADSLAKVNPKKKQKKKETSISLKSQGRYTIQTASWRSEWKAQKRAKMWKGRGFKNAYTVKYHGSKPGDIWHRVRLGYTDSRQKAEKVQQYIQQKYQTKSWIQGSP